MYTQLLLDTVWMESPLYACSTGPHWTIQQHLSSIPGQSQFSIRLLKPIQWTRWTNLKLLSHWHTVRWRKQMKGNQTECLQWKLQAAEVRKVTVAKTSPYSTLVGRLLCLQEVSRILFIPKMGFWGIFRCSSQEEIMFLVIPPAIIRGNRAQ